MKTRKLTLNRETIRALQPADLRLIVGGLDQQPIGPPNAVAVDGQMIPISVTACIVTGTDCACPSTMTDAGGYLQPLSPNG